MYKVTYSIKDKERSRKFKTAEDAAGWAYTKAYDHWSVTGRLASKRAWETLRALADWSCNPTNYFQADIDIFAEHHIELRQCEA